jgi:hypothetical protein
MLKIIDSGCNKHKWSQLIMFGSEAELLKDILYNLPRKGGFHTFICEYGCTHRVSFQVRGAKGLSGDRPSSRDLSYADSPGSPCSATEVLPNRKRESVCF